MCRLLLLHGKRSRPGIHVRKFVVPFLLAKQLQIPDKTILRYGFLQPENLFALQILNRLDVSSDQTSISTITGRGRQYHYSRPTGCRAENVHVGDANGVALAGAVHGQAGVVLGLLQLDVDPPLLLHRAKLSLLAVDDACHVGDAEHTPRGILAPGQRKAWNCFCVAGLGGG